MRTAASERKSKGADPGTDLRKHFIDIHRRVMRKASSACELTAEQFEQCLDRALVNSKESSARAARLLREAASAGAHTLRALDEQGEQLSRSQAMLDEIGGQSRQASRNIKQCRRAVFAPFFSLFHRDSSYPTLRRAAAVSCSALSINV